jgi:hypothetical protein
VLPRRLARHSPLAILLHTSLVNYPNT